MSNDYHKPLFRDRFIEQAMRHLEFCNERIDKTIANEPGLAHQLYETLELTGEAYNQLEEILYRLRSAKGDVS